MPDAPILTEEVIAYLLAVPKPVPKVNWRQSLLEQTEVGYTMKGKLDLDDLPATGPVRGKLHLYSRRNLNPAVKGDWSVGFVFTDYAENSYRVVRCNGPHPSDHPNVIEGTVIERMPHVHLLTERYQRLQPPRPDGFAEVATGYDTFESAVDFLAGRVALEAVGTLFL